MNGWWWWTHGLSLASMHLVSWKKDIEHAVRTIAKRTHTHTLSTTENWQLVFHCCEFYWVRWSKKHHIIGRKSGTQFASVTVTTKRKFAHHVGRVFFLVACSVPSLKTRFLFRSFILLKLPACYSIKCNPIRFKNEAAHESTRIFQFVSGFFHFHFDQSSEERHIYELGPIDSMATWCVSYNRRHCDRMTGGFDAMAKNVRRDLSPFRCFRNWTHSMISAAETEV